jgi:hypothetical protein
MMVLPPPDGPARPERRARDRRVSDRRKSAKAKGDPILEPEGAGAPRFEEPLVEAVSGPAFRTRGRGAGRRRSDRETGPDTSSETRFVSKPHAPLVAQLIATALNLEQTRVKRRGSEKDAAALYAPKTERAKPSRGEA